jgi:hypothetical protein
LRRARRAGPVRRRPGLPAIRWPTPWRLRSVGVAPAGQQGLPWFHRTRRPRGCRAWHFAVTCNGHPHVMVVSVAEWDELRRQWVPSDPQARADLAETAEDARRGDFIAEEMQRILGGAQLRQAHRRGRYRGDAGLPFHSGRASLRCGDRRSRPSRRADLPTPSGWAPLRQDVPLSAGRTDRPGPSRPTPNGRKSSAAMARRALE